MMDDRPDDNPPAETTIARASLPREPRDAVTAEEGAAPASTPARKSVRKKKKASLRGTTKAIEERIGHAFADPRLLTTALTHVSSLKDPNNRTASYQRLEFLGDHVLGLVISDMLFQAFPHADEGELSKRLSDLVRRETCADVARAMGLHEAIKLGAVGAGAADRLRNSVLGDICEAVIGAVYLDGGYPAARQMIEGAWSERMRKPLKALRDPKTVLQEWAQGKGLPTPTYREVERTGPHHDPKFRISVELPDIAPAEGIGSTKRTAEKAAAFALLAREGVVGGRDE